MPPLSGAQPSVSMHGMVDVAATWMSSGNPRERPALRLDSGTLSASRWGIRGTEALGGDLSALFDFEAQMTADDGNGAGLALQRRSFAGLAGTWGQVQLGRDYTPTFWSLLASDALGFGLWGNTLSYSDFFAARYSRMIAFRSSSIGGLELNVAYSAGEIPGSAQQGATRSGVDVSALHHFGPLMLTGAHQVNREANGRRQTVTSIGGGLAAGALEFKGGYSRSETNHPGGDATTLLNVGGTRALGTGQFLAQYIRLTQARTAGRGSTVAVAYIHPLSRHTNIHFSLALHRNNAAGNFSIHSADTSAGNLAKGADPRVLAVGVRHTF